MVDTSVLKRIREQEMDRKEFLKYSGLVVLGLVGVRGLISLLDPLARPNYVPKQTQQTSQPASRGFGSGKYGV